MKQGAQGSAGTGNPPVSEAGRGAAAGAGEARVPSQGRAADLDVGRGRGRGEDVDRGRDVDLGRSPSVPAARGEHVHSEAPIPRPRTVVQRASVRGQVLDALRTALVTGELMPGVVYSAPALGDRFGVSATPVREAMQQLAQEGAVEVVPNRGFRVVERGARELAELAEVRALIEIPVMLRLARTVPAERWAELRPLAEATVRAASTGCRATYAETDRTFHRAVLSLCGNEQLVQIADDLHRRAQWPLETHARPSGRHADLLADAAEHMALLDALIAGDVDGVRVLVGGHFAGDACGGPSR
ncbi:DNA-binding GntR family transcriptional regulator [Streptomyces sp. V4I8]|uniref:GntR family transcriptional regulator n=1 Tax=Streptomyces sp. V4I8 TaxID=3156469 RepID=UPI003515C34C